MQLGREAEAAGLLAVGDLVTAEGHIVCGHCLQCRLGAAHLCQRTQIIGVDRDGAFAEFIAMPASNVMQLDGIPTEIGAIMDPMGNAVHTVLEAGGARQHGAGARLRADRLLRGRAWPGRPGASLVIASDFNPMRLDLARAMGAHVTLNPGTDDVLARVRELTGGDGVDLVCEMSGHPSGHAQAFAAARLGGRVNLLGHAEPHHRGGLRPRRDLQGAHALRRDRPQDVRDLGPDAPLPPRRPARPPPRHHPPLSARVASPKPSRSSRTARPAR